MAKTFIKKGLLTMLLLVICCAEAFAMTQPGASAKFKFISDLVVNDVIEGPIGYSVATGCAAFSAGMLIMSKIIPAICGIAGTAIIIGAPKIVESAGALII